MSQTSKHTYCPLRISWDVPRRDNTPEVSGPRSPGMAPDILGCPRQANTPIVSGPRSPGMAQDIFGCPAA